MTAAGRIGCTSARAGAEFAPQRGVAGQRPAGERGIRTITAGEAGKREDGTVPGRHVPGRGSFVAVFRPGDRCGTLPQGPEEHLRQAGEPSRAVFLESGQAGPRRVRHVQWPCHPGGATLAEGTASVSPVSRTGRRRGPSGWAGMTVIGMSPLVPGPEPEDRRSGMPWGFPLLAPGSPGPEWGSEPDRGGADLPGI